MKVNRHGSKGIGDILKGLGELVEKLTDVEAQVEERYRKSEDGPGQPESAQPESGQQESEFRSRDGRLRGVYGINVKVGLDGKEVEFEPFGHVRRTPASPRGKAGKEAVVEELREPLVDVFEEPDRTIIVAEMPGVAAADVKLSVEGDLLILEARRADRRYQKEIQLPGPVDPTQATVHANNGVIEISLPTLRSA